MGFPPEFCNNNEIDILDSKIYEFKTADIAIESPGVQPTIRPESDDHSMYLLATPILGREGVQPSNEWTGTNRYNKYAKTTQLSLGYGHAGNSFAIFLDDGQELFYYNREDLIP